MSSKIGGKLVKSYKLNVLKPQKYLNETIPILYHIEIRQLL